MLNAPYTPEVPLAAMPSHDTRPQTVPNSSPIAVSLRLLTTTQSRVGEIQSQTAWFGVGGRSVAAAQTLFWVGQARAAVAVGENTERAVLLGDAVASCFCKLL